jgi:hypothetical protein
MSAQGSGDMFWFGGLPTSRKPLTDDSEEKPIEAEEKPAGGTT